MKFKIQIIKDFNIQVRVFRIFNEYGEEKIKIYATLDFTILGIVDES